MSSSMSSSIPMTKSELYKHRYWPSPLAKNLAIDICSANTSKFVKPIEVRRWSHETALDCLAAYVGISRSELLAMHPIDYLYYKVDFANSTWSLPKGAATFPKSVWEQYTFRVVKKPNAPCIQTLRWLFNGRRTLWGHS